MKKKEDSLFSFFPHSKLPASFVASDGSVSKIHRKEAKVSFLFFFSLVAGEMLRHRDINIIHTLQVVCVCARTATPAAVDVCETC